MSGLLFIADLWEVGREKYIHFDFMAFKPFQAKIK